MPSPFDDMLYGIFGGEGAPAAAPAAAAAEAAPTFNLAATAREARLLRWMRFGVLTGKQSLTGVDPATRAWLDSAKAAKGAISNEHEQALRNLYRKVKAGKVTTAAKFNQQFKRIVGVAPPAGEAPFDAVSGRAEIEVAKQARRVGGKVAGRVAELKAAPAPTGVLGKVKGVWQKLMGGAPAQRVARGEAAMKAAPPITSARAAAAAAKGVRAGMAPRDLLGKIAGRAGEAVGKDIAKTVAPGSALGKGGWARKIGGSVGYIYAMYLMHQLIQQTMVEPGQQKLAAMQQQFPMRMQMASMPTQQQMVEQALAGQAMQGGGMQPQGDLGGGNLLPQGLGMPAQGAQVSEARWE